MEPELRKGRGRRREDQCALCETLWGHHDKDAAEHREMVCNKIKTKADAKELRGVIRLVAILVTITCVVVAGQAVWLRQDISRVDYRIERVHQRVSDNITDRERSDFEQNRQLSTINTSIQTLSIRISGLEEQVKKQDGSQTKGGMK
jgi:hypothetical protein